MLIGRDPEQRLIESLLDDARGGASAALVIRGEAGIGKTAVLEDAADRSGMLTLRCRGMESEHDLPFSGLEQLLRPVRDLVDHLPGPQASALRGAFGLSDDRVEDRLLLGLATLSLLAEASEDGPLICLVDDLQWLDGASAQALLFAARRLGAEGVVMLLAVRDSAADWFETPGLQQVTLAPLSDTLAREVIARRRGGLGHAEQQRLVGEAGGNPLALLELPAHDGPAGEATGIEAAFRARLARLSAETRRLLLLAAARDSEEAGTWTELAQLDGLPPMAQLAAVDAGLIGDVDAIVFRHPLVRSAVYRASSGTERSDAHRLLASIATDPLSRASHLAAAADRPDEALAVELETAAADVAVRGAFASAASAFVRAADLSTDAGARVRRVVRAAQAYLDAGESDAAAGLAGGTVAGAGAVADEAALAAVKGALEVQRGTLGAAYHLFLTAARGVAAEDPLRALELQAQAMFAGFVGGWPERAVAEAHELVKDLPPVGGPYEQYFRASLDAMVGADAVTRGEAEPRLPSRIPVGAAAEDFRFLVYADLARAYLGDLRGAHEMCARALAFARMAGSFNMLPLALLISSRLAVVVRDFDQAEEAAREGIELSHQLSQENLETFFSAILARCLAARGQVDESRELGEAALKRALAHGVGLAAADSRLALAEIELSLGHGAAARELIEAVPNPLYAVLSAPDMVEASLLGGDPESADTLVGHLSVFAERTHDPQCLGLLARARALLAPTLQLAEPLFLEALQHQTAHAQPFERARTALAYGECLRRAQRKTEARVQLRDALATFEGLNTPLWADRARAELEATGITARKRDPSTLDTLTPQELRIAKLVAAGATNRDVAAQLFLSQKTVEYHLRKVFLKLGVSSRVELARQPLQPVAVASAD